MRIGELAERTATTPRSLRYYEQRGLLTAARTDSGIREYGEEAVDMVVLIQCLLAAGMNTATIAALMPCACTYRTTPHMIEALERGRAELDMRMRELTRMRDLADEVIEQARALRVAD